MKAPQPSSSAWQSCGMWERLCRVLVDSVAAAIWLLRSLLGLQESILRANREAGQKLMMPFDALSFLACFFTTFCVFVTECEAPGN